MTAIIASGPITQQIGLFRDEVSQSVGDSTDKYYCGPLNHVVSSTAITSALNLNETELFIDPKTGLISLQTERSEIVGVHEATITATLVDYVNVPSAI